MYLHSIRKNIYIYTPVALSMSLEALMMPKNELIVPLMALAEAHRLILYFLHVREAYIIILITALNLIAWLLMNPSYYYCQPLYRVGYVL